MKLYFAGVNISSVSFQGYRQYRPQELAMLRIQIATNIYVPHSLNIKCNKSLISEGQKAISLEHRVLP